MTVHTKDGGKVFSVHRSEKKSTRQGWNNLKDLRSRRPGGQTVSGPALDKEPKSLVWIGSPLVKTRTETQVFPSQSPV